MADRLKRPDEDPMDWMLATGRVNREVYDIVMAGRERRAAEAAGPRQQEVPPWTPRVLAAAPAGVNPRAFSANPAVDAAAEQGVYRPAVKASNGNVPTLFANGDLPPATASGLDPNLLASVPWQARHPIAAEPDRARASELLSACSGPDGWAVAEFEFSRHPANQDYEGRVAEWTAHGIAAEAAADRQRAAVAPAGGPEKPVDELTGDELYDRVFGAGDRYRAALRERRGGR